MAPAGAHTRQTSTAVRWAAPCLPLGDAFVACLAQVIPSLGRPAQEPRVPVQVRWGCRGLYCQRVITLLHRSQSTQASTSGRCRGSTSLVEGSGTRHFAVARQVRSAACTVLSVHHSNRPSQKHKLKHGRLMFVRRPEAAALGEAWWHCVSAGLAARIMAQVLCV
jgi:hypothetical protein